MPKSLKFNFLKKIATAVILLVIPLFSRADVSISPPITPTTIPAVIDRITGYMFWAGMVIAPIMFMYAGFMFMWARGDSEKITKAKNMIYWTIVGVAVIIIATGIPSLIQNILGK